MYDNWSYPYGADGPDAPWNIPEVPEKEFEECINKAKAVVTALEQAGEVEV